jgi:uncharacterized protein YaaQ
MKMILAVVRDEDREDINQALIDENFRVTRIASTGGFFRRGSTTFMIGVEDDQVDAAIQVIRENCPPPSEPGIRRVTIFVINVAQYAQI